MKKLVIKDRKKFNRFLLIALFFTSLSSYLILSLFNSNIVLGKSDPVYLTVQEGDTIWEIASYLPGTKDIREKVHDIYRLNKLNQSSNIFQGQRLKLPIYE